MKNVIKKIAAGGVMTLFFLLPLVVDADETLPEISGFVPLQPISGVIEKGISFNQFVNGLFWLSIAVGATLAVIMVAIGGFQYMGSESFSNKEDGIKRIQGAVGGLILILLTVVLFTTINPDILTGLNIKPVTVKVIDRDPLHSSDASSIGNLQPRSSFTTQDNPELRQAIERSNEGKTVFLGDVVPNPGVQKFDPSAACKEAFGTSARNQGTGENTSGAKVFHCIAPASGAPVNDEI